MSDLLLTQRDGRLLHLTLNRPEKRNALNGALCRAVIEAVNHANADHSIGAIVLAAAGTAYCAGMDLQEMADDDDTSRVDILHEQLFTIGARISKPIVAAVHGAALGGGTGLVANCHVAVAGTDATFGLTEIRLGLWPFLVFRSIVTAVGERRAVELSLTGRTFPAAEARELGLVHEVAPDPLARALEIGRALAESSPTAIQNGLLFVQQMRGMESDRAGELARMIRQEVFASEDFAEGLRAFLEKRRPQWPSIPKSEDVPKP